MAQQVPTDGRGAGLLDRHGARVVRDPSVDRRPPFGVGGAVRARWLRNRRDHGGSRRTTPATGRLREPTPCRLSKSSVAATSMRRRTAATGCSSTAASSTGYVPMRAGGASSNGSANSAAGSRACSTSCATGSSHGSGTGVPPIPIIHCPKDGPVAVPEEDLPGTAAGRRGLPPARNRPLAARHRGGLGQRALPEVRGAGAT